MRHSGGGPYVPPSSAEIGLEREHLECTCFVSKRAHKFTFVFEVFTEKKARICVLIVMALPKSPLFPKFQIVYSVILK